MKEITIQLDEKENLAVAIYKENEKIVDAITVKPTECMYSHEKDLFEYIINQLMFKIEYSDNYFHENDIVCKYDRQSHIPDFSIIAIVGEVERTNGNFHPWIWNEKSESFQRDFVTTQNDFKEQYEKLSVVLDNIKLDSLTCEIALNIMDKVEILSRHNVNTVEIENKLNPFVSQVKKDDNQSSHKKSKYSIGQLFCYYDFKNNQPDFRIIGAITDTQNGEITSLIQDEYHMKQYSFDPNEFESAFIMLDKVLDEIDPMSFTDNDYDMIKEKMMVMWHHSEKAPEIIKQINQIRDKGISMKHSRKNTTTTQEYLNVGTKKSKQKKKKQYQFQVGDIVKIKDKALKNANLIIKGIVEYQSYFKIANVDNFPQPEGSIKIALLSVDKSNPYYSLLGTIYADFDAIELVISKEYGVRM